MSNTMKIYYDSEADFLEVQFSQAIGYMRETDNDNLMERVDLEGNIIGFSVLNVRQLAQDKPLIAELITKN
ncbi:DUF2283 domain-containing protein [Geminocystis sp. GBBB08]|uniref:DUF2283 domain-containing protein n=1 Tax=Geminocystis sp. GBBB08 TaxID=2604140 RepID=UPI0027E3928C|nr:DUF2283 domain-containing protein [Geminocystis sp. GBBB08]MBL1209798.1 DUF2283 domain-containing protein [Geminocystis sp. GBBB08]